MQKTNDLSIIIVNYNTGSLLVQCLDSIKKSRKDGLPIEIIIIDNASTDNSVEIINKYDFDNLKHILVRNLENSGFAKANNIGIKKATGKYILLLNPDTEVFAETIITMVEYMDKNKDVSVSTCFVELRKNGQIDDASHRGFPTPWNAFCHFTGIGKVFSNSKIFNGYHLGYQDLNKIHPIDSCVGAFMLVRKEVGDRLNWLDEDYFWYGEDIDFCYRVKEAGGKVMFVPVTKIVHWKGASSGIRNESQKISTATLETKTRAISASTEAMRIFYRKHYVKKYPRLLTGLIIMGINLLENIRLARIKK